MTKKLRIGIIFGGKSAEHQVSIQSAKNVLTALDKERYEPVLIGIDKQYGGWHECAEIGPVQAGGDLLSLTPGDNINIIDVAFPVLHGPMGEDGTVQGLLELAGIPYVGPGVLGSAVGMDKDVMKRLLRDAGIPITKHVTLALHNRQLFDTQMTLQELGLPMFVKPANMGSSVGVTKVQAITELKDAIDLAFTFDRKILIESAVVGDEVECAILGNDNPQASLPGKIMPQASFYSYDAKYIDADGAKVEIPAQLSDELVARVQQLAIKTFQVLCCEGMARVDMFVTKDGEVLVNEINTIPGFTEISMYPKMWEVSGLAYKELITRLLELAVERFDARQAMQSSLAVSE